MESEKRNDKESDERGIGRKHGASLWKWGIIYYNPSDPRVWLPKRVPAMGCTLNFAHRAAYWWLIGLMGIPLGIVLTASVSEWMSRK